MNIKDIIDITLDVFGVLGIIGAAATWLLTRKERETNAAKAVAQIDKMATNDLVHMNDHLEKQTEILAQQTVILTNVDKNIAVLVDRTPRV